MVGSALASSFRQQQAGNDAAGGAGGSTPAGYRGYGYSSSHNNSGDGYAYRRPSEEGGRAGYGSYSSSEARQHQPMPAMQSAPSTSSAAARAGGQNYQLQNSGRPAAPEDMQSSLSGGASPTTSAQRPLSPAPTSNDNVPPHAGPSAGTAHGSSTSRSNTAGSPEEIENSRRIARTHFDEFRAYLDAEGQRGESPASSRTL